jgi:very-short-patch-repair endonuclease
MNRMQDRQRQFARRMRAEPTDAERVLWQRLRHDIALSGTHFRRQALIGPFIVDFASRKARLVIEVDGGQHDEQRAADERRTRKIEALGYRVLRFWNNEVLGNLDGVLIINRRFPQAMTSNPETAAHLLPSPLRGGAGDGGPQVPPI